MEIKQLSVCTAPDCFSIWQQLQTQYHHPVGGHWSESSILEELSRHRGLGVFAPDGTLAAFCLYRKWGSQLEIMILATAFRWQRGGFMRALIRGLLRDLVSGDVVWLEVHSDNRPAISLYSAMGFVLMGDRKGYYSDGGKALLFEYVKP